MKRLFLASLVSATLIGCGNNSTRSQPDTVPPTDITPPVVVPPTDLVPSTPLPTAPCEKGDCLDDEMSNVYPSFDLTPANYAPVIGSIDGFSMPYTEARKIELEISDPNGDELTIFMDGAPEFITVSLENGIYFLNANPRDESDIGIFQITLSASDGSLATAAPAFRIIVAEPLIDLTPSSPVPPTADCGENGECLEDNFEIHNVLLQLGLTDEEIAEFTSICDSNIGMCVQEDYADGFYIQLVGGRYYPLTKRFSAAISWHESYNLIKSKFEFLSSHTPVKHELLELPDAYGTLYLIAQFEADAVQFRDMSHDGSEMTFTVTVDAEGYEFTQETLLRVNTLESQLLKILEKTYGENSVNEHISEHYGLSIEETNAMCERGACTMYPDNSLTVVYPEYNLDINGAVAFVVFKSSVEVSEEHYNSQISYNVTSRAGNSDVHWYAEAEGFTHAYENDRNELTAIVTYPVDQGLLDTVAYNGKVSLGGEVNFDELNGRSYSHYLQIKNDTAWGLIDGIYNK